MRSADIGHIGVLKKIKRGWTQPLLATKKVVDNEEQLGNLDGYYRYYLCYI